MAKSAASERGRYRAATRDYAAAYNREHPNDWWLSGRRSFPNLHMRRKHPGWLREPFDRGRAPYAERKKRERMWKGYAPTLAEACGEGDRKARVHAERTTQRAGRGDT